MPIDGRDPDGGDWQKEFPQIDQILKRLKGPSGVKFPGAAVIVVVMAVLWLASGVYIVKPAEVGVVKRFGAMNRTVGPGPHWHAPYPFEVVMKPNIAQVRRIEIGFRTIDPGPPARYRMAPKESHMLTGDENIVNVQFIVQYKVKDASDFLFQVYEVEEAVKFAAEAAMREIVGKNRIDEALTTGKQKIKEGTKDLMQAILDHYHTGVSIEQVELQDVQPPEAVIAAFKDVASAREDKSRTVNEAEGYHNDLIPKAKGEAAKMLNGAMAYREEKINHATGDADRFVRRLDEYRKAKNVTRRRLYLETMQEILPGIDKVIIDPDVSGNLLPYLPLMETGKGGGK